MILRDSLGLCGKFIFNDPDSYKKLRVPWDVLKGELESLEEREVIKEIQNTTYITQGINRYSHLQA